MFSNGITTSAPSASITRWRASSASLRRAARVASASASCCGNSSSLLVPSVKWMMRRRASAMSASPSVSCLLHWFQLAAAHGDALAHMEPMRLAGAHRAALTGVHRHRHLVARLAEARLHLRRSGGAEGPAFGAPAVEAELRDGADHRFGVEPRGGSHRGRRPGPHPALVHFPDGTHFPAHEAGLRPRAKRNEAEQGGGQAHRYSEMVWMK